MKTAIFKVHGSRGERGVEPCFCCVADKQTQSAELFHFTEVCISASVNHDLLPLSNKQRYLHSTRTPQMVVVTVDSKILVDSEVGT